MTDQPYVPDTASVRFAATFPNVDLQITGSEFDRWLAERDATIEAALVAEKARQKFFGNFAGFGERKESNYDGLISRKQG